VAATPGLLAKNPAISTKATIATVAIGLSAEKMIVMVELMLNAPSSKL
jgi:hypothetical protein